MKNWINLKLGEHLCMLIFLHFPYSGLCLLTCVAGLWKERGRGFRAREKGEKRARGGVGNTSTREIKKSWLIRIPNKSITALIIPFSSRLPEIFSLFVAHLFLVVGSCVSRPYAVLPPRSILELFVPLNRFLFVWSTWGNVWWWIEPEKYFGFCGFLVVCSNWEFFFCDVLDLRKCLLVKKK